MTFKTGNPDKPGSPLRSDCEFEELFLGDQVKSLTFFIFIFIISPIVIFSQDLIIDDPERFKDKRLQEIHDRSLSTFDQKEVNYLHPFKD